MQPKQPTNSQLLKVATSQLEATGVEQPYQEALALLSLATLRTKLELLADPKRKVETSAYQKFRQLVAQRADRKPYAYLAGFKPFWKSTFLVTPATLIPRPETELVVETVLKLRAKKKNVTVLELGVGSGCLLLSLLLENKSWQGVGTDISATALEVAVLNANNLGLADRVSFFINNWQENKKSLSEVGYDVVVSNPPYLTTKELSLLEKEVADYEPKVALDGGANGLQLLESVINCASKLVKAQGLLVLEHGVGQGSKVSEFLEKAGFNNLEQEFDLAGKDRVMAATRKVETNE